MSFHLKIYACLMDPTIMSWLWDEWYCVSCMGHMGGDE